MVVAPDPAKTLKAITLKDACPPFILVVSPDRIRKERTIQHLIEKFAAPNLQDSVIKIRAEDLSESRLNTLSDEIFTVSLFSPLRFFIISDIEEVSLTIIDKLIRIIENLDKTCKVFVSASKITQNNPLYKVAKKNETLLLLDELKGYDLRRWSERELRNFGIKKFEESALDRIIEIAEHNPDEISQCIEQLAIYIDDLTLTEHDVSKLFTKAPDPSEFALLDLLLSGNRGKCEVLISQLVNNGKSPFALLGLLARSFSNYLLIAQYIEKGLQRTEIKQRLAITPWVLNKAFPIAERYGVRKLRRCLRAILIADSKLKNRSLGTEIIFSELTSRLTA